MSRQKRNSAALKKADVRMAGMKSVDPALDLGNGLTLAAYVAKRDALKTLLDSYNSDLSNLDAKLNDVNALETQVHDLSARMLQGVGSMFGRDSNEYEQSGGTRLSERKPAKKSANGNGDTQPH